MLAVRGAGGGAEHHPSAAAAELGDRLGTKPRRCYNLRMSTKFAIDVARDVMARRRRALRELAATEAELPEDREILRGLRNGERVKPSRE